MVRADSRSVSRAPRYSGYPWAASSFAYAALTLYGSPFQRIRLALHLPVVGVPRPRLGKPNRFRLFPFRSPLLRESHSVSFPGVTEMFHFTPYRLTGLCIHPVMTAHDRGRVAPFGDPRIIACLRLPAAYRSLPRPSSPPGAEASTMRP